jgi:predicted house-cleaning noncanonical NTP pyrophosphatase (MazG superfamily)
VEKLVRDKIPALMKDEGLEPNIRTAQPHELPSFLFQKLLEEVAELVADPTLDELADVAEILRAISKSMGIEPNELEQARETKAKSRGAFELGFVLLLN